MILKIAASVGQKVFLLAPMMVSVARNYGSMLGSERLPARSTFASCGPLGARVRA